MGYYFDEQIRQRMQNDDEVFAEAYHKLTEVVIDSGVWQDFGSAQIMTHGLVEELAACLNVKLPNTTGQTMTIEQYLDDVFLPQGIMWREVRLKDEWYRESMGVMLGTLSDGRQTIFVPTSGTGYTYRNPDTGKRERVTAETAKRFRPNALLLYRSLPLREINMKDIRSFILRSVSSRDIMTYAQATLIVMLLSMIIPDMTRKLIEFRSNIPGVFIIMAMVVLSGFAVTLVKQLTLPRITTKIAVPMQAAFMMRLLTAPTARVKSFAAGDLGQRIGMIYQNMMLLTNMTLSLLLTAACSFVCFLQMFVISPALAGIALALVIMLSLLYYRVIVLQAQGSEEQMNAQAEESGLTYNLIDGAQKIQLTGAEKRAFAVWAGVYQKTAAAIYNPPLLLKISSMLTPPILLAGNILLFLLAARTHISQSNYYAFSASFAIVTGALCVIPASAIGFAKALPMFKALRPLMDFTPEVDGDKEMVKRLKGQIQLQNVTFRYVPDAPPIIDDLTMNIRPGKYVAIVGSTGCGKSTLMKLMLGFERPESGEIFYDGHSLSSLNVTSLRQQIGTVMQNAEIFQGTIFENIAVASKSLTVDEAWHAAELAGVADDIRKMPLQMNTPLAAGGRGVSGGQKQRLMIARAIASKPKILFFDEATSALDNITQKAVTDAFGEMRCTRVVIAHRLSTIQDCDTIFCLDKGKIVEQGTYQELVERDGFFANLVRKQQI